MKTFLGLVVLFLATLASAQSQFSMVNPAAPMASCPTPVAGSNILCSVTDGYYVSVNGAAYTKINQTVGVASFNGRTGNVLPAANDYSFSLLSGAITATQLPATLTCNFTATVPPTGPGTIALNACK